MQCEGGCVQCEGLCVQCEGVRVQCEGVCVKCEGVCVQCEGVCVQCGVSVTSGQRVGGVCGGGGSQYNYYIRIIIKYVM